MSCGCRLAAAAPIRPLAWDLPYAASAALKKKRKKKMVKQENRNTTQRMEGNFASWITDKELVSKISKVLRIPIVAQ